MSNKPNTKKRGTAHDRKPQVSKQWWQSPILWVVGLVVVAGAAAIAVSVSAGDDADISVETAFVEALGEPLPAYGTPDSAIGLEVPLVKAQTLEGERIQFDADGIARLYGFFAHWCPHCQADLPATAKWLEANPLPAGVEMVAVSTSVDQTADNYPPSEWFAREGWSATVLLDSEESKLGSAFGLTSFPYWVAVDGDGLVVARASGVLGDAELEALVAQLSPA